MNKNLTKTFKSVCSAFLILKSIKSMVGLCLKTVTTSCKLSNFSEVSRLFKEYKSIKKSILLLVGLPRR